MKGPTVNTSGVGHSYWFILISASFMVLTVKAILGTHTPLLPLIIRDLHMSYSQAGLIFTASVGLSIVAAFVGGIIVDRFNVPKVAITALIVILISSALSGLSADYLQLLVTRAIAGMYVFIFISGAKLVADNFPRNRMGLAQGIFGAASIGGPSISAATLPTLSEVFNWRGAMIAFSFILVPSIILCLVLLRLGVRSLKGERQARNLVAFYKGKNLWILFYINMVPFGSQLILTAWLPTFLVDKLHLSLTAAGSLASISFVLGIIGRIVGGGLADRYGARYLMLISAIGLTISYTTLALEGGLLGFLAVLATGWLFGFYSGSMFSMIPKIFGANTGKAVAMAGSGGNLSAFVITPFVGLSVDLTGDYMYGMLLLAAMSASTAPLSVILAKATT